MSIQEHFFKFIYLLQETIYLSREPPGKINADCFWRQKTRQGIHLQPHENKLQEMKTASSKNCYFFFFLHLLSISPLFISMQEHLSSRQEACQSGGNVKVLFGCWIYIRTWSMQMLFQSLRVLPIRMRWFWNFRKYDYNSSKSWPVFWNLPFIIL